MTFCKLMSAGAVALLASVAAQAATVNVDFDSGTAGASVGTLSPGVVFSGATYTSNLGLFGSSGALGIVSSTGGYEWGSSDPITVSFAPGVTSFSIGVVDFGSNGFTVEAFDASNHLLGSQTKFGPDVGVGYYDTVSVSFAGIASIEMFQPLQTQGDGIILDNMTYTTSAAVPEPSMGALIALGMGVLTFVGRRRKA